MRTVSEANSSSWRNWSLNSALGLCLLSAAGFASLWALNIGTPAQLDFGNRFTPFVLTASGVVFAIVGWLIASRRPGNRIGLVALGIGLFTGLDTLGIEYTVYATRTSPGALPGGEVAAWLANFIWVIPIGLIGTVLVLLFPDGHLPGPRWRLVMAGACVGVVASILYFAFAPGPLESLSWVENPFGLRGSRPWIEILSLGFFLLAATIPPAAWSMRRRYRRASGAERAQIRWFAAAAALVAVTYVGQFIYSVLTGTLAAGSESQRWFQTFAVAGFGVVGASVGIAVLRHHLYEIDRIISRTVSYALVLALLGVIVLALVTGLAFFMPSDDPLVVAVATLTVFALFTPIRRRVQLVVDRRFNRSRYDSARVIDQFAGSLQERVDPEGVVDDWVGVVEETMQPVSVAVWVRDI